MLNTVIQPIAGRLGLVGADGHRRELGRVRSAVGAVAAISRERDEALEQRIADLERELDHVRAITRELYTADDRRPECR